MSESYNPIMRTFCRFRAGVLDRLDLARHEIRPGTPLETLLPVSVRRGVWKHLRERRLRLPDLELSERDRGRSLFFLARAAFSFAFYLRRWDALVLAFPLALAVFRANRHRAVQFPLGLRTVGDVVIYATSFAEHKDSGYRWTRNEIALKVRMIVAEQAGRSLEDVRPETRFTEFFD